MRLFISHRLLTATMAFVITLANHAQAAPKPTPQVTVRVRGPFIAKNQEQLYCDSSYALAECRKQIETLQRALRPYPLALLPKWKWVLVRADRWMALANSLHMDRDSPAVTLLDDETTLLEESLISPQAGRAAELMGSFKTDLNQLLDVAISHELGHAICREKNEFKAESMAREMRRQIAAGVPVRVGCVQPVIPTAHEGR
jgi:hypothetical protein